MSHPVLFHRWCLYTDPGFKLRSKKKKKLSCFRKSAGWNFFHHLPARIVECVSEYVFFVSKKQKKKKKPQRNKKQKKLEKIEKQKKPTKKGRKKMLLLLTISVENLTGYGDIVWHFALCTFNLHDQPTKWERVLKNNKLWTAFVYICLLFVQGKNQDMLMQ